MAKNPSDSVRLFGTEEPVVPMRTLVAGPVSCKFDQGALRFIKVYGKEAIRNIAFVVRDKDWGTYLPTLSNLQIEQNENSFSVAFDAICKDAQQEIHYAVSITGAADGSLSFSGKYTAITDFLTNRTGFVVLHPVTGVAGHPVTVEHVNGDIQQSEFPSLVDPIQPFKNIRALTHDVLPGVGICCRMIGDTFEMEDHRQWNDASYKTYVRPIALPWPFTIPATESLQQSVSLTISGSPAGHSDTQADTSNASEENCCVVSIQQSENSKAMPAIGLGLEPQHLTGANAHQQQIRELAPQQLVVWHELGEHDSEHLKQAAALGHATGAPVELQAVIPDNDFITEISTLATQCQDANLRLHAIHVAPAIYLKSIMPGTSWPEVTPLADIYGQVRKHFPDVAVGGGMLSFFPELNRYRPPMEHLDFISHASNTITHACDDITVTENLEALPYIIKTCRSFAGDKPYHVGPSSIGMRFNPYGSKTMDNPHNARIAMARMDPRQRGLINAAWTVGYVAHLARGGVDCINLHAPTGEFGIFNEPERWSRPGFDETTRQVYPVYHVMSGLIKAAGKQQLSTHSTMSREVEAVGYEDKGECVLWVANLSCDSQMIKFAGLILTDGKQATLSLETFDHCTQFCDGFEQTTTDICSPLLTLEPCSVVRLTLTVS